MYSNADFQTSRSATPPPRLLCDGINVVGEVNRPYRSSGGGDFLDAADGAVEKSEMNPMLDFGAIDRAIGGADRMLAVSIPTVAIMAGKSPCVLACPCVLEER
jgi:hypothetical protein